MQQTEPVTMPFGKHKGRLVTAVNTPYLSWLLRECHNASPALRAAVQTELARRAAARRPPATLTPTPSANDATASRPTVPPAPTGSANASSANLNGTVDHLAVLRLLSDLLDAGLRVVARGEGSVHVYGGALTPDLRDRLAQYHTHLDALARWVRWESPVRPRVTPATVLLARFREAGVGLVAHPDGAVAVSPGVGATPLGELTAAGQRELWVRVALNLPDPCSPVADAGVPHPNVLAGLHRHCLVRAERAALRAAGEQARRWRGYAAAVRAVRNGQVLAGTRLELVELVGRCKRQAAALERRGQQEAAVKWRRWAEALRSA